MKKHKTAAKAEAKDSDFLAEMQERAKSAREADQDNRREAVYDLQFRAGINQWPEETRKTRQAANQPCLVINRVPQFIRQVTGDIRQMKPALKAYGVDDHSDREKAELVTSVLRYIENRSDATDAYFRAVDSQVTCGIGHWRVDTEYCDMEGDVQDIVIRTIDDQVNVLWDPDAIKPSREDAAFCFIPVDMTFARFKALYPESSISKFDTATLWRSSIANDTDGWWSSGETIRVAEYWERRETRDGKGRVTVKLFRSVVTGEAILEKPEERPGKYIPVIPVIGEEVRFDAKCVRHGVVRYLRDPQQRYNYWTSAQTEIVALQPKSPYLVTNTQVEDHLDLWNRANQDNLPFLTYTPDPKTGGGAPQRAQPPVTSQGFAEGVMQAAEDMHAVTGIYPSALGAKSNETSGVAIQKRQQEGDTGTYVYTDNFLRALKHTGRVILDLLPSFYDTTRTLRIIGEDGALDEVKINQPIAGIAESADTPLIDEATNVSLGQYDIFVQAGPSFSTRREEARDGMLAFIQAFPPAAPLIADMMANAQDWPNADKIAERLKTLLPDQIKQKEAQEAGGDDAVMQPMQPQVPPPEMIAAQVEQEVMQRPEFALKMAQARKAEADAMKSEFEVIQAQQAMAMPVQGREPVAAEPDPMQQIEMKAIERMALGDVDLQIEQKRRALEHGADPLEVETGPRPVDVLAQSMAAQGEAIRDGMMQLADAVKAMGQAQLAPTRLIRDDKGRAIGAEKVM